MRLRTTFLSAAGLIACGGGTDSVRPEPTRGIRIVAGANVTDTVMTAPRQALVVEVHDSTGALVPTGTVVRFSSVRRSGTLDEEVLVQALSAVEFGTFASSNTDAAGRASVIVQFGTVAGTGRIAVSVPVLGVNDTARFTILPGAASRVLLEPADTLLNVGKSFTYRGGVTDQFGNPRSDAVTWKVSSAGVVVSAAGALSSTATGRYTIIGSAGAGADTTAVSVVPAARLVGTLADSRNNYTPSVGILDIDGSGLKVLAPVEDGGIGPYPVWMPDRSSIIYSTLVGGKQLLYVVDTNGVSKPFFPNGIPNVTHQADPRPSRDGKWLFFAAYDSRCSASAYCLYRSRIDGSQPELLGTAASSNMALRPSPSPDGSHVAFAAGPYGGVIKVLDVATLALSSLPVRGTNPSWSPDGTVIAFVSDFFTLSTIRPDGSSLRTINTPGRSYTDGPVSWTPDGKFLMARSFTGRYDIVDVQTGAVLPLQYSTPLFLLSIAP
ncbi:MAG: hypothetical protein ABJE10_20970 [bacterium]